MAVSEHRVHLQHPPNHFNTRKIPYGQKTNFRDIGPPKVWYGLISCCRSCPSGIRLSISCSALPTSLAWNRGRPCEPSDTWPDVKEAQQDSERNKWPGDTTFELQIHVNPSTSRIWTRWKGKKHIYLKAPWHIWHRLCPHLPEQLGLCGHCVSWTLLASDWEIPCQGCQGL